MSILRKSYEVVGHTTEHGEIICPNCIDDLLSLYGAVVSIGLNPIFLSDLDNDRHIFTCGRCHEAIK